MAPFKPHRHQHWTETALDRRLPVACGTRPQPQGARPAAAEIRINLHLASAQPGHGGRFAIEGGGPQSAEHGIGALGAAAQLDGRAGGKGWGRCADGGVEALGLALAVATGDGAKQGAGRNGVSLAEFVDLFPGVTQEQARSALEHAARSNAAAVA
jgi:hypothetical protein